MHNRKKKDGRWGWASDRPEQKPSSGPFTGTVEETTPPERGGLSRIYIWGCDHGDPMPEIRLFYGNFAPDSR